MAFGMFRVPFLEGDYAVPMNVVPTGLLQPQQPGIAKAANAAWLVVVSKAPRTPLDSNTTQV
jgi:hypothetical protein